MKQKNFDLPTILTFGDLHLGHSKVPTAHICQRLWCEIEKRGSEIDMIVINGDIFDTALYMTSDDSRTVLSLFVKIMNLANANDITIRVIRGTFSHDRSQINHIVSLYESYDYKFDFKYFDDLNIEYIDKYGIRMVYIPDDIPYNSSDEILAKIQEMMAQAGWESVHLISYHGYSQHMLPYNLRRPPKIVFNSTQFKQILHHNGYVLSNHVHTGSLYGQIIGVGSYDRLRHGEEENKGMFIIKDNQPQFIKNKDATPFYTIDLSNVNDKDECVSKFKEFLMEKFPTKTLGYVRVVHHDINIRQLLQKVTSAMTSCVTYSSKSSVKEQKDVIVDDIVRDDSVEVQITEENIATFIHDEMVEKKLKTLSIERINQLLKGEK